MIFKAYITDLEKIYHGLYNNFTKSGSTVIMGEENQKRKHEALEHLNEAISLLQQIS